MFLNDTFKKQKNTLKNSFSGSHVNVSNTCTTLEINLMFLADPAPSLPSEQ